MFKSILLIAVSILFINHTKILQSQTWSPVGGGTSSEVFAVISYNNDLIIAGTFSSAGGVAVNRIVRWDGSTFYRLTTGTEGGLINLGVVRCLAVYNGELIVGGYFATAGGLAAPGIAKWNGGSWSMMGTGMGGVNPYVEALTVYNGQLIAGGTFTTAGGVPASCIASWNGSSWTNMSSGMTPSDNVGVYSLEVYNTFLYAGGDFLTAGGNPVSRIARWTGATWVALGTGIQGSLVKSMAVYSGWLYAGGTFNQAGSTAANNIARWNGGTWATVGAGTNNTVYALFPLGTYLYVGGFFTYAGGNSTNYIARWNNATWSLMGVGSNNGTSSNVTCIGSYSANAFIAAGGYFLLAGGFDARRIALWGNLTRIDPTSNNVPENFQLNQNYPNPFNPVTTITFDIPKSTNAKLEIFDAAGKSVEILFDEELTAGKYEIKWDASNKPSGNYFYNLTAGDFVETKKMSLVK